MIGTILNETLDKATVMARVKDYFDNSEEGKHAN